MTIKQQFKQQHRWDLDFVATFEEYNTPIYRDKCSFIFRDVLLDTESCTVNDTGSKPSVVSFNLWAPGDYCTHGSNTEE